MNPQDTKKRRMDDDDVDDSSSTSEEVMRMMKSMQKEINYMKHKMNEMEGRLRKTDQLERECNALRGRIERILPLLGEISHASAQISASNDTTVKALDDMKSKLLDMEKSTNENVSASLRYHRQLIDNTRWEYSAAPIENSYWAARGFDQDEIEHVTNMVQRMKDSATNMRRGCALPAAGFHYGEDSDAGDVFLWDETLYPHWREFTDSLYQYRYYLNQCQDNPSFGVYLCNIELTESTQYSRLENALKGLHFNDLSLHYNDAGSKFIPFVARVLKNNRQCEQLSLVGNQFEGTDNYTRGVYNRFWDTISEHPSLYRLNLSNCFNGSLFGECPPAILREALFKLSNLTQIELKQNRITGEKATYVADFLRNNSCLIDLDLSGNPINDDDAAYIADALGSNRTLRNLTMVHSNRVMTETGARALRRAVYDDTSLNSIVDSNHVCRIESNWDLTKCNFMRDPKENRKRKLLRVLHSNQMPELIDRGLPEEEGGIAQKLIPLVLELVQESFYGDTSSLSLVYTIMKGWRMPLLYENYDRVSSS